MAIKASERNALLRIIKGRFEVLDREVGERRQDLIDAIIKRIREEREADAAAAKAEQQQLVARAEQLAADVAEFAERMRRERGVVPGTMRAVRRYREDEEDYTRQIVVNREDPVSLDVVTEWAPVGVQEAIDAAMKELDREYGAGRLSLRRRQLEIEEAILTNAVESDGAKVFLAMIPDVDVLVPGVNGESSAIVQRALQVGGANAHVEGDDE